MTNRSINDGGYLNEVWNHHGPNRLYMDVSILSINITSLLERCFSHLGSSLFNKADLWGPVVVLVPP